MLDQHFSSARARHKLRVGPLGPLMDGFAQHLHEHGYTRVSARAILRHVAHWSRVCALEGEARANRHDAGTRGTISERPPAVLFL